MKVCVIVDNEYMYNSFSKLVNLKSQESVFDFFYTSANEAFVHKFEGDLYFKEINLNNVNEDFIDKYDLFISLHSKQKFPQLMINKKRCINVHPGYNPDNRGCFSQVFSIINKKRIGVTIHEMDNELDHGPIIYQHEVKIKSYDTSYDIYIKLLNLENELLTVHLEDIIEGNYTTIPMNEEGNINRKIDFENLCKIDMQKRMTVGEVIDLFRATTFAGYDNAYFIDEEGNKVYVSITLKKEI